MNTLISSELTEVSKPIDEIISELKSQVKRAFKYKRSLLSFVVAPRKSATEIFSRQLSESLENIGLRCKIYDVHENFSIESSLNRDGIVNIIYNLHNKPELIDNLTGSEN